MDSEIDPLEEPRRNSPMRSRAPPAIQGPACPRYSTTQGSPATAGRPQMNPIYEDPAENSRGKKNSRPAGSASQRENLGRLENLDPFANSGEGEDPRTVSTPLLSHTTPCDYGGAAPLSRTRTTASLARHPSVSINNPTQEPSFRHRVSIFADPLVDPEELDLRVNSLRSMRPFGLIGVSHRLIDWNRYRASDAKLAKMRFQKDLKKYYVDQNEIIDRYIDVDHLLDTGVHYEMIQNYEDNTSSGTSSDTSDEDSENSPEALDNFSEDMTQTPASNTEIRDTAKLVKPKKVRSKRSSYSRGDTLQQHAHVTENAVPGNIDTEGARVLGESGVASAATVKAAIALNFAVNVFLLMGKVVVVYMSQSMSIMASLVDSILDFMSTLIIFFANKFATRKSARFPIGRHRLEPIGILVFSIIIIISFLQVLISAIKRLMSTDHSLVTLDSYAIGIMVSTVLVKFICYIWCSSIKNSSVQALAEDAKTDVIFNTFSLIFPLIESIFQLWWVDAAGAACLCLYVISQWSMITFEHIDHLCGSHASKEDYHQILYLVTRFSDKISAVKNYRIYHQGDLVNVEVDIVISDHHLSLRDCHDLGESLQYAIETLPFVERCFVHLDYKVRNYIGHIEK